MGSTEKSYLTKEKFNYNLSKRMYEYYTKDLPPLQEIDKNHPAYKYVEPNIINYRIFAALFQNPLGGIFEMWFTFQGYGFCSEIETRTMNCLEAYGLPQSMRKCVDLVEDYFECQSGFKSERRLDALRKERRRQFDSGERKFKYAVPPKIGVYQE